MRKNTISMDGVTKELLAWENILYCPKCECCVKLGQIKDLSKHIPMEDIDPTWSELRWVKLCPQCKKLWLIPDKHYQRGLADWEQAQ